VLQQLLLNGCERRAHQMKQTQPNGRSTRGWAQLPHYGLSRLGPVGRPVVTSRIVLQRGEGAGALAIAPLMRCAIRSALNGHTDESIFEMPSVKPRRLRRGRRARAAPDPLYCVGHAFGASPNATSPTHVSMSVSELP
jgi:hypothetical protein